MGTFTKWCFLIYPDSAPKDWKNILDNTHIPCAISPLHQPDPGGEEGEKKKEHWHIILDFGQGKKSQKQILEISQGLLNGTYPEPIISPIGYYEYLIHKNHPDKEQFDEGYGAITYLNGFDLDTYQKIDKEDKLPSGFIELIEVINDEGITEFARLVSYCMANDRELLNPLRKDSYFFNSYMRSMRGIVADGRK